jgi:hypothetical protein
MRGGYVNSEQTMKSRQLKEGGPIKPWKARAPNEGSRSNDGLHHQKQPRGQSSVYSSVYLGTHRRTIRPPGRPRGQCIPSGTAETTNVSTNDPNTTPSAGDTHPLALAFIVVASDHVPIAPDLTPAVQTAVVHLGTIIGTVGRVYQGASTSTGTGTTTSADSAGTDAAATTPINTGARQSGRMGDDGACNGHTRALEPLVNGSRPAPDGGDSSRRIWCDMGRVSATRCRRGP